MKIRCRILLALVLLPLMACRTDHAPAQSVANRDGPPESHETRRCPEAVVLEDKRGWEPGSGSYRAEQIGDTVFVYAEGMNPTPNYEVRLARRHGRANELVFHRKPPGGIQLQVLSPFSTCVRFSAGQRLTTVTLHDAQGEQKIPVKHHSTTPQPR